MYLFTVTLSGKADLLYNLDVNARNFIIYGFHSENIFLEKVMSPVHVVFVSPIVGSISHFFLVDQRKICPVRSQIFFVHSLEFFENVVLVSLLADQLSGQFLIF